MKLVKLVRELREAVVDPVTGPPINQLWVVYAAAGRQNGWAIVHAAAANLAKRLMKESTWLTNGRITSVESFTEYCEGMGMDCQEEYVEMMKEHPELAEYGKWYEVDWGT